MKYAFIPPPPELTGFVRFYWTMEAEPNNGDHFVYRTMATGSPQLMFHCGEHSKRPAMFYGQTDASARMMLDNDFSVFGVCFFPFALTTLFNIPASEITGKSADLYAIAGPESSLLEERIASCADSAGMAALISGFFLSRMLTANSNSLFIQKAVKSVLAQRGEIDIDKMAADYFLSRRQFERKFKEASGFSPKAYAKIARFESVLKELSVTGSSLTEIAYSSGYYDQSHFTHDFSALSGFNPKQFLVKDQEDRTWIDFVAFFQFLSFCPPVLCRNKSPE